MWSTNFTQPRLCTKFGKRVFSFARLSEWNAVLEDLRAIADILDFREQFSLLLMFDDFLAFSVFMDCCNAPVFIL